MLDLESAEGAILKFLANFVDSSDDGGGARDVHVDLLSSHLAASVPQMDSGRLLPPMERPSPQVASYSMVRGMDQHLERMQAHGSRAESRFLKGTPPTNDILERLEVRQRELSYLSGRGRPAPTHESDRVSIFSQSVSDLPELQGATRSSMSARGGTRPAWNWSQVRAPDSPRVATAHDGRPLTMSSPRSARGFAMAASASTTSYSSTFRGTQNERFDRSIQPFAANGTRSEILATSSHSLCSGTGKIGYF